MKKDTEQLCPNCKTGQDTYLLDNKNPFCPYLHFHNGASCKMYKSIKNKNKRKKHTKRRKGKFLSAFFCTLLWKNRTFSGKQNKAF